MSLTKLPSLTFGATMVAQWPSAQGGRYTTLAASDIAPSFRLQKVTDGNRNSSGFYDTVLGKVPGTTAFRLYASADQVARKKPPVVIQQSFKEDQQRLDITLADRMLNRTPLPIGESGQLTVKGTEMPSFLQGYLTGRGLRLEQITVTPSKRFWII